MNQDNKGDQDSRIGELNPYAPGETATETGLGPRPQISVFLAIMLAVSVLAAFYVNIGLGICSMILAVPAYIRSIASSMQKMSSGQQLTNMDRFVFFLNSVGVVLLCLIAGSAGFFATCFSMLQAGPQALNSGFVIGLLGIAFLVSFGIVYWLFWPKKRK